MQERDLGQLLDAFYADGPRRAPHWLLDDLKLRVDDVSRRLRGVDELEKRVAKLEKEIAALKRAQKPSSQQKAPARKAAP